MRKISFLLGIVFLLFSCSKDPDLGNALGINSGIIGSWKEKGFEGDVQYYQRSADLDFSVHGFMLGEEGSYKERAIEGWCATPPVSYATYEGSWEVLSDSLLDVVVGYWGGTRTYQIRILFLEGDELGIRFLSTDERVDSK